MEDKGSEDYHPSDDNEHPIDYNDYSSGDDYMNYSSGDDVPILKK